MSLKPWREVAIPHQDVLKGSFQQAEFAADLSRVHDGSATKEYQDASLFFERTFITEGMRLLLDSVIRRLVAKGGEPVIQLQTSFGGGKTHTMLAVYHLVSGAAQASELQGISTILDAAGVTELPKAKIIVLDGINLSASQPRDRDGLKIHTLWGDLAWQLGGIQAYERIRDSDLNGTSPAKDLVAGLLRDHAPCVILVDELVAYLRQFEQGKTYTGGSFDSNLTFVQALTEALKSVPNAILLASLPESRMEVGSAQGQMALDALEKYFGRVQALWKPVAAEEAFEIVRRRLFVRLTDTKAMEDVCRTFADYYVQNDADFPNETLESHYFDRLKNAYPIHPEIFDRLYQDWSTIDKFQRTRGVLKLMAKVIHRLWKDDNKDSLILPGSLPLYDSDVRNEAINYLPQGWDPVIERDIDGDKSETTLYIDNDTRFGAVQAGRRTARTIFLGSAPSTANQMVRGIELSKVLLGCAQPGQPVAVYKDALNRLTDRLHYLNTGNGRFWFDTRPNLRREMEERKRRFDDDDVFPVIKQTLQEMLKTAFFDGVHVFAPGGEVPDDYFLRLVVLSPKAGYSKATASLAFDEAGEILKTARGGEPRHRQNRLFFLAADYDSISRMKDAVRRMLAWQSIVNDIKDSKLNLDQLQKKQAEKSLDDVSEGLGRMIREAYRWLLVPIQEVLQDKSLSEIQWEAIGVSSATKSLSQELESKLKEHELLISDWAPIHLSNVLKAWFWKDNVSDVNALEVWQKSCCYLYFPKLKNEDVYRKTISAGASSTDFFALAYGKNEEGRYQGFNFGVATATTPLDSTVILIEPAAANAFQQQLDAERMAVATPVHSLATDQQSTPIQSPVTSSGGAAKATAQKEKSLSTQAQPAKTMFYATTQLSTLKAKIEFGDIVDEVVHKLSAVHNVKVSIKVEISAENSAGFDEKLQRDIKENCSVLKFRGAEFE